MNRLKTLALALVAMGLLAPAQSHAAEPDRDTVQGTQQSSQANSRFGDDTGDCTLGTASADLDANNVRARMFNNGGLFWKGGDPVYEVPRGGNVSAIFASGIWVGGQVNGELRFAGAEYGDWEFWPGPLGPNGEAPSRETCAQYDRFWKISQDDIDQYLDSGATTNDLTTWPADLGAPVINTTQNGFDDDGDGLVDEGSDGIDNDEDGKIDERDEQEFVDNQTRIDAGREIYDLTDGDLPDIIGNQTIWWIMNDRGNDHLFSEGPSIGLEVTVQAFAFATSNAINNTTFYKYNLRYKGDVTLEQAYLGLWSDPDLGDATDDYVGSDAELGLGFVYNADDDDGGSGYGLQPPATGYDYFQGPLVNNDGIDNDEDGEIDEDDERIALSVFIYYNNSANPINGGPSQGGGNPGQNAYSYLTGVWKNGQQITVGGDGTGTSGEVTQIMYPGNPPEFWSEYDADPAEGQQPLEAGDRRFIMSSGPFTIEPGDAQEIVYGIVWSQAQSGGALASVAQLKRDDTLAQQAFDNDFEVPRPPDAPTVNAQPLDGAVALTWSNARTSNNYLNSYDVFNPFAVPEDGDDDRTYTLEGYEVYQVDSPSQPFTEGTRLAVFDRANGITSVTDVAVDPTTGAQIVQVVASGRDNGIQNSYTVRGLDNNRTYYFIVRAYSYNAASSPERVYASPILFGTNLVSVIPSKQEAVAGGTVINADTGDLLPTTVVSGDVRSPFRARVADPGAITGDTYEVRFRDYDAGTAGDTSDDILVYDVVNTTTGATVFDGGDFAQRTGVTPISNQISPTGEFAVNDQVPIIDGFQPEIIGLTAADTQLYAPGCGDIAPAVNTQLGAGRPVQRIVFEKLSGAANTVPEGTVIRFYSDTTRVDGIFTPGPDTLFFPTYDNAPAYNFVETRRPGGEPACGGSGNQQGCDQSDGVWVYAENRTYSGDITGAGLNGGANSTGEFHVTSFGAGAEGSLTSADPLWAPNEFEIRFVGSSYATHIFGEGPGVDAGYSVPFELWDIGNVAPGEENNPDDDIRMIPVMFSDTFSNTGVEDAEICDGFIYQDPAGINNTPPNPVTDRVYMYFPATTYDAWAQTVETLLFPFQAGTVIQINTAEFAAEQNNAETAQNALDLIGAVPNPYRGRSDYETSANERQVRFVNLPSSATIRIFTISGTLVREIVKPASASTVAFWDLENQRGLPVASGMYLVHVEARNPDGSVLGERVLKLGVVQRRPSIDIL